MILAKVQHIRCADYEGATYVWVPDGWTRERFRQAVDIAHTTYMVKHDARLPELPRYPLAPDFAANPDKLVRDVLAEHATASAEYAAKRAAYERSIQPFSKFLAEQGLTPFHDVAPEYTTELDWGHHHGEGLDPDDTVIGDVPGPHATPKPRTRKL